MSKKAVKGSVSAAGERRKAFYKSEIEERALLLRRLGHSAASVKSRVRAYVAWDFEVGPTKAPHSAAEIDAIVDALFLRGGTGAGSPTV